MLPDSAIPIPARPALFLDFDGTLVHLAPTPESVEVDPALPPLLMRLTHLLGGALAIVSGRPIHEIDRFLAPLSPIAGGLHGLEWRDAPNGEISRFRTPPSIDLVRGRILSEGLLRPGILIEDKGIAIAVHYRHAPELGPHVHEQVSAFLADFPDLSMISGKMVVEVKPLAVSKASAVMRLMQQPPFQGRTPVFIGDDTTDEDGIRAAQRSGGFGIKVGEGPSAATLRLSSVDALHEWLRSVANAVENGMAPIVGAAPDGATGVSRQMAEITETVV